MDAKVQRILIASTEQEKKIVITKAWHYQFKFSTFAILKRSFLNHGGRDRHVGGEENLETTLRALTIAGNCIFPPFFTTISPNCFLLLFKRSGEHRRPHHVRIFC